MRRTLAPFLLVVVPVGVAGLSLLRPSIDVAPTVDAAAVRSSAVVPSRQLHPAPSQPIVRAPDPPAEPRPTPEEEDPDPVGTRVAVLDGALSATAADPAWSRAAEDQALAHLRGHADIEPLDVACVATFCRIEFAVLDPSVPPSDIVQAATPWHAPAFVTMNLEGERIATLFLAREGYVLPGG